MATYKSYPSSKEIPSRKSRKGLRNSNFVFNKKIVKAATKERRLQTKESANG